MVQAWRKVDFGTGTVTFLDDTQKEDMLQVEYPNGFLLDMGWYQDRYIISIIHNFDWTHPVKRILIGRIQSSGMKRQTEISFPRC